MNRRNFLQQLLGLALAPAIAVFPSLANALKYKDGEIHTIHIETPPGFNFGGGYLSIYTGKMPATPDEADESKLIWTNKP